VICPTCDTVLQTTERKGIEIDYCPKCRGAWLDRGELDRIVERSVLERRSADFVNRKDGHPEDGERNHQREAQMDRCHLKKKGFFGYLFG
jgi:uncharacterized protein